MNYYTVSGIRTGQAVELKESSVSLYDQPIPYKIVKLLDVDKGSNLSALLYKDRDIIATSNQVSGRVRLGR